MHEKETLQNHYMSTSIGSRLVAGEVGVFSREIPPLSKTHPHTLLRSHLPSLPMDVFSGDYGNMCNEIFARLRCNIIVCATAEL